MGEAIHSARIVSPAPPLRSGVVDNLGVDKVWEQAGTLLVSDRVAAPQLDWRDNAVWRLLRYTAIADSQGSVVRKRWTLSNLVNRTVQGAYWEISKRRV